MAITVADEPVLARIEEEVVAVRGLAKQRPIPLRFMTPQALRERLIADLEVDYTPLERETDQKLLVTLGLLRPEQSYLDIVLDLYQEQVVGLYDQEEDAMFLIGSEPLQIGLDERVTFAHEFTHALQDQHFDLQALLPKHPDNIDRSAAVQALVEGDAVLLQSLWAQQALTRSELQELTSGGGGSGASKLAEAPLVVRTELLFPYTTGLEFALAVFRRAGGYAGLDEAFRSPPASTEQVIHPERYFAREAPVPVELPDLAAALGGGWRRVNGNTLGELYLRILVQQYGDAALAQVAAAGWGGDRWQLLEKDGKSAVVLRTAWDTDEDAREFFSAYSTGLSRRFPSATEVESSPSRQALTAPGYGTELRRNGREVLAVIAFDRASAEALAAAVSSGP